LLSIKHAVWRIPGKIKQVIYEGKRLTGVIGTRRPMQNLCSTAIQSRHQGEPGEQSTSCLNNVSEKQFLTWVKTYLDPCSTALETLLLSKDDEELDFMAPCEKVIPRISKPWDSYWLLTLFGSMSPIYKLGSRARASSECPTSSKASVASRPSKKVSSVATRGSANDVYSPASARMTSSPPGC